MSETLNTTKPDKEFLKFAEEFSDNCAFSKITPGMYLSQHKQYSIEYLSELTDPNTNKPIGSDIRVSSEGMKIQVSKKRIESSEYYSVDYIYYLLIWCWFRNQVNTDFEADELAVKYYLSKGRPAKDVNLGFIETIKNATKVIEHNKKRLKNIEKLLK